MVESHTLQVKPHPLSIVHNSCTNLTTDNEMYDNDNNVMEVDGIIINGEKSFGNETFVVSGKQQSPLDEEVSMCMYV